MLQAMEVMEALAFNIAGHHGGLPDRGRLRDRIRRKRGDGRIVEALKQARVLLEHIAEPEKDTIAKRFREGGGLERLRRLELWIRMLHSALVDADCLDTEAHLSPDSAAARATGGGGDIEELWNRAQAAQEELIARSSGKLNELRAAIYRDCVSSAKQPQGFFSLTVPTGGGKTRSALSFGLRHALVHGLDRVTVVLPYTSIIEQNADDYRKLLEEEDESLVLEHHTGALAESEPGEETRDERWTRLAAENWDAPVVVTTSVQLFESLFTNRNPRCRKLHNVARSVIVLDEVQTLPPRLLEPTLEVLRELVDAFGVTVLLCTATQPALLRTDDFVGLHGVRELTSDPAGLFAALERVRYEIDLESEWTWGDVARELAYQEQVLAIFNTVADAQEVVEELVSREVEDVLHLSTRLCGAHRRTVLKEVKARLDDGRPVRLVSTQVVEAGVDLDFPVVLRALGPLDSLIQAAGRCNREGRLETGRVLVFEPADGGVPPGAYAAGLGITRAMLREDPALDLHDPSIATEYFRRLYGVQNLDRPGVQEHRNRHDFEQTDRAYRIIEDDTTAVLVRYDRGAKLAEELFDAVGSGRPWGRLDFRRLQPYVVSLREHALRTASQEGLCTETLPGIWVWEGRYDALRGLVHQRAGPERTVVA